MEEEGMKVAQKKGRLCHFVPVLCHFLCHSFVPNYITLPYLYYDTNIKWHRKKGSVPHTRARIKKGYIGAVPTEHLLYLIKGSVSYT